LDFAWENQGVGFKKCVWK